MSLLDHTNSGLRTEDAILKGEATQTHHPRPQHFGPQKKSVRGLAVRQWARGPEVERACSEKATALPRCWGPSFFVFCGTTMGRGMMFPDKFAGCVGQHSNMFESDTHTIKKRHNIYIYCIVYTILYIIPILQTQYTPFVSPSFGPFDFPFHHLLFFGIWSHFLATSWHLGQVTGKASNKTSFPREPSTFLIGWRRTAGYMQLIVFHKHTSCISLRLVGYMSMAS